MGSDSSKFAQTRKRSGLANVFAGGDCQRSAGDTKAARGLGSEEGSASEESENLAQAIPLTPKNCKPGRVKPPQNDPAIAFMADMECALTTCLLKEGVSPSPTSPTHANTVSAVKKHGRELSVSPLAKSLGRAEEASAAYMSAEVVALPAYRTTGLVMIPTTTQARASRGKNRQVASAPPAPLAAKPKASVDEKGSTGQGLTITNTSATESPRIACEELIDTRCEVDAKAAPASASASPPTAADSATCTSQGTAPAAGQLGAQAVVGGVYFEALRRSWRAAPQAGTEAAARAAALPPLATANEVGSPVDILHVVNQRSASYPTFKRPVPLTYMIAMLKPRWEDEGLYEQVEEQERYAQIEAARRARHRR